MKQKCCIKTNNKKMTKNNFFPLSFWNSVLITLYKNFWCHTMTNPICLWFPSFITENSTSGETCVLCRLEWLVTLCPAITKGFSIAYNSYYLPLEKFQCYFNLHLSVKHFHILPVGILFITIWWAYKYLWSFP